ncbi:uncharacterized protein M6B38_380105 [Iris pallida]|uniref:Uncharacterized protein n=1 Tax=Iris pallida TaxID=29817 RepID=A0AAX6G7U4_IRIPA|nr:uncharacterized protein M6B38_380105 [Iris pallida]
MSLLRPITTTTTSNFFLLPSSKKPLSRLRRRCSMAATTTTTASSSSLEEQGQERKEKKLPILLFDVMDTLVRDPFYNDIPQFFKMSMKELLECKHPTAWVEFEKGQIDEIELANKFFKDGRPFDLEGLKECMVRGYFYIDGMEPLLQILKEKGYELHAFTNYPIWYMMIDNKLKLSDYLSWTFCSCKIGKRKPAADSYVEVLHHLGVEAASCVFVDDRVENVEAARNAGMVGLHFRNADSLKQDLFQLGIELQLETSNRN